MPDARRDYYEVLGVARDADEKAIRDAFRKLALQYHPDRNKAPDAEARFKDIAEAYAVLSDREKRAEYDTRGFPGVAGFSPEDLFGGIDFGDLFGDLGLGFDLGSSLFDRLFGSRATLRRESGAGSDVQVELPISLDRVSEGGKETIRFSRPLTCPACRGSGAKAGTAPRRCATCGGTGQRVSTRDRGGVHLRQVTTCSGCAGRGTVIEEPCTDCAGSGQVVRDETLEIPIPPGVEDGISLRMKGRGLPGAKGGRAGDLYAVVRVLPDPRFERDGADLWRTETIEVPDAVLGARIEVPTLGGAVEVVVPRGTQPGAVLRLRGKGLPRVGGGARGNLNVRIQVRVPESTSAEERELYERLRTLQRHPGRGRAE